MSNVIANEIGFMQGRLSPSIGDEIQSFPWDTWQWELQVAGSYGFKLMEWVLDLDRFTENPLMSADGRRVIRDLSHKYDVRIHAVTCDVIMKDPFYKASGLKRKTLLRDFERVLEAARDVGMSFVVVPLVDAGRLESEEQLDSLRRGLVDVLSTAANGVQVLFESDYPPRRLKNLVESFPRGLIGINYDIGNSASLGHDPVEEVATYGRHIENVHVKDRPLNGTTVPLGAGDANFPSVFGCLRESGYAGNYVLQTARATDGDDTGVLVRYRKMVECYISQ